ncbi:hypothetical protein RJ639_044335 [Escallonia herrerae]|uniref:PUA domain-containing protein n=1 Tax=Escallonia herrerae TaxID=1293975 RepID=A0AA89B2C9_9ASTE|nr:hypothetical protein RJ639_044335 [Escallonia herrerae]
MAFGGRVIRSLALPSSPTTTTTLEEIASLHKGVAKVVLKKGKTQLFRDGSPMVYSGAVDRIIGRPPPKTGDVVLVADGTEKPIGWGLYNSVSMFCVRLMQQEEEASWLSGLVIDIFGDLAVIASSAAWVENYKPQIKSLVMENGISYMISLEGQKTGFFADQRENRQYISTISEGQKVLDMCCYTGGFALNAARGQAMNVTGITRH